jgi:hypothetical protein
MAFSQSVRTTTLLWCDRHCCLCKKACGTNIEIHHIVPESDGGSDEIDNAMPLCFDCHSEVMKYNDEHPRGNKYKPAELRARREQVYEEFTRHLVPPIDAQITNRLPNNQKREFPDVGFLLRHVGQSLPVRVKVRLESVMGDRVVPFRNPRHSGPHYSGEHLWNLNPQFMFSGHFTMPEELIPADRVIELRVHLTVVDQYGREHNHLPVGFIYQPDGDYWYAEP